MPPANVIDSGRAERICILNSFELGVTNGTPPRQATADGTDLNEETRGRTGTGLWLLPSLLNHACICQSLFLTGIFAVAKITIISQTAIGPLSLSLKLTLDACSIHGTSSKST
jgi:hypothetical protein